MTVFNGDNFEMVVTEVGDGLKIISMAIIDVDDRFEMKVTESSKIQQNESAIKILKLSPSK